MYGNENAPAIPARTPQRNETAFGNRSRLASHHVIAPQPTANNAQAANIIKM
jgi:hypothetical protein